MYDTLKHNCLVGTYMHWWRPLLYYTSNNSIIWTNSKFFVTYKLKHKTANRSFKIVQIKKKETSKNHFFKMLFLVFYMIGKCTNITGWFYKYRNFSELKLSTPCLSMSRKLICHNRKINYHIKKIFALYNE